MDNKPNSLKRRASGAQGSKRPTIMTDTDFNMEESSPQVTGKKMAIDNSYLNKRSNYTVKSQDDKRFEFDSAAMTKKRKQRRMAKRKRVMTQANVDEGNDAHM